jgi:ubiquinone biosynthesis protein Coq4
LGKSTAVFLKTNNFELLDKLESHDVMHVLLGMKTTVKEEIGMQFLLLGNGKKSVYMYATIVLGYLLQIEHYKYFSYCYRRGKAIYAIHKIDFYKLLWENSSALRSRLKKSFQSQKVRVLEPITL